HWVRPRREMPCAHVEVLDHHAVVVGRPQPARPKLGPRRARAFRRGWFRWRRPGRGRGRTTFVSRVAKNVATARRVGSDETSASDEMRPRARLVARKHPLRGTPMPRARAPRDLPRAMSAQLGPASGSGAGSEAPTRTALR